MKIIPLCIHSTVNPVEARPGLKPKTFCISGMRLISWQVDNPTVAPVQVMQLRFEYLTCLSYNLAHNMDPTMVAVPYHTGTMWQGPEIVIPLADRIGILERLRITAYREGTVPAEIVPAVNFSMSFIFHLDTENY